MEKPQITAYLKTYCGWSEGVRAIFRKYDLPFEEKDIIKNPAFRWEMEQRSGQPLSPCVEVNGTMLADVSGEEVERWLTSEGLLEKNNAAPDAPSAHQDSNIPSQTGVGESRITTLPSLLLPATRSRRRADKSPS